MALACLVVLAAAALGEEPAPPPPPPPAPAPAPEPKKDPKWSDVIKLRGYTQFRYDNLPSGDVNPDLKNSQGDRYIGGEQGFGIRRLRLIVYGDVDPRWVAWYFQTDFASVVEDNLHVPTLRDAYADIFLTKGKELRFRVGQSKVPFGFENLQSSQNRLALDRADPLNSAVKDERDLGVFFYAETQAARKLYKSLVDDNLKGSGDYGMLGVGIYNGQTANKSDETGNFHVVGRITVPVEVGSQVFEVGTAAYTGVYRVSVEAEDDGTEYGLPNEDGDFVDRRVEGSFVWYPKPVGVMIEATVGEGPAQAAAGAPRIVSDDLFGVVGQLTAKIDHPFGTVSLMPYVRAQRYAGGKKFETNVPRYDVRELELGAEWQFVKPLEVTLAYTFADRTEPKFPYAQQQGQLLRAQVQINY